MTPLGVSADYDSEDHGHSSLWASNDVLCTLINLSTFCDRRWRGLAVRNCWPSPGIGPVSASCRVITLEWFLLLVVFCLSFYYYNFFFFFFNLRLAYVSVEQCLLLFTSFWSLVPYICQHFCIHANVTSCWCPWTTVQLRRRIARVASSIFTGPLRG